MIQGEVGDRREILNKVLYGRLRPKVQTLTLIRTIFSRKGNPLSHILSIENGTPSHTYNKRTTHLFLWCFRDILKGLWNTK